MRTAVPALPRRVAHVARSITLVLAPRSILTGAGPLLVRVSIAERVLPVRAALTTAAAVARVTIAAPRLRGPAARATTGAAAQAALPEAASTVAARRAAHLPVPPEVAAAAAAVGVAENNGWLI